MIRFLLHKQLASNFFRFRYGAAEWYSATALRHAARPIGSSLDCNAQAFLDLVADATNPSRRNISSRDHRRRRLGCQIAGQGRESHRLKSVLGRECVAPMRASIEAEAMLDCLATRTHCTL